MISLRVRADDPEIMDDLDCQGEVVDQTLRELDLINHRLGGNSVTLDSVSQLLAQVDQSQPIVIADIGCGGGDMAHRIATWAKRKKLNVTVVGIDANPNIIRFARENHPPSQSVTFEVMNVMDTSYSDQRFDIVVATLFMHHFSTQQLVGLFRVLHKQTRLGFVVNDIHRHPLAYYSIKWLTSLFSRSSMVKFDAPLSVRRAFTRKELEDILRGAGIATYSLKWRWAFRWQLVVNSFSAQ